MQVVMYSDDGSIRIIHGTDAKVIPVVDAVIAQAPAAVEARILDNTDLNTSASLADPRTPTSKAEFITKYPNAPRYNEA